MTASIDQERADFEAWARDRYPSIDLTRDRNDYSKALAKDYWSLWQAARRATAVPVPQGWKLVPKEATPEMLEQVWYLGYDEMRDAYCVLLAAAPQPPEAAPVQLPEYGIDTANHAGIRVRGYTEQQVRKLLEARGIKVAP